MLSQINLFFRKPFYIQTSKIRFDCTIVLYYLAIRNNIYYKSDKQFVVNFPKGRMQGGGNKVIVVSANRAIESGVRLS
ncbi:MAG: hypothetical protein HKUEN01_06200 [Candidatus Kuenenia stuttgartiensis]|nr:MAG: hypothetical protein CV080_00120 [Candidatus Kuenenia stuttgartiensis]GJQ48234.1 MAG: hypothetical protein HKUEN01_06200 [Candidatus Kuenenia stuttgartiensis]